MDVVVVGAGQSGLVAGYYLNQTAMKFQVVGKEERIGDTWRNRYDSLRLFTPREFSQLPGLALKGDPKGRPDRIEFADYLEHYAATFALPARLGSQVHRITRRRDDTYELAMTKGPSLLARNVILAFGTFPGATLPAERKNFSAKIFQTNASAYRNPHQLPTGPVLIVGDGASGRGFAAELAATHEVYLSGGRDRKIFPDRFFGKSIWWWLKFLGFFRPRNNASLRGMAMPLPNTVPERAELQKLGVRLLPKFVKAKDDTAWFEDGSSVSPKSVIWSLGHSMNTAWIDIAEAKDGKGRLLHKQGVSTATGLYFVGQPYQTNMSSGLILGVGADAQFVVNHLVARDKEAHA